MKDKLWIVFFVVLAVQIIAWVVVVSAVAYVAIHFIHKHW